MNPCHQSIIIAIFFIVLVSPAAGADFSNTLQHVYIGDAHENEIHAVDLIDKQRIGSIRTSYAPDKIIVAPFAPILVYFNSASSVAVYVDLRSAMETQVVDLPIRPINVVLDTTGSKIGITNSQSGGFVLLSAYSNKMLLHIEDFPAANDVLFDPNDVDIFFTNSHTGSLGRIDSNVGVVQEIRISEQSEHIWASPSRNLDSRYLFVANDSSGEVLAVNKFTMATYKVFKAGIGVERPYTTPAGLFLYLMNSKTGTVQSYLQSSYRLDSDIDLGFGVDLTVVGSFDRRSLFASSQSAEFALFDNFRKKIQVRGEFKSRPIDAKGLPDGSTAIVALAESEDIAFVDLESGEVSYVSVTANGATSMGLGLTNNICH